MLSLALGSQWQQVLSQQKVLRWICLHVSPQQQQVPHQNLGHTVLGLLEGDTEAEARGSWGTLLILKSPGRGSHLGSMRQDSGAVCGEALGPASVPCHQLARSNQQMCHMPWP